MPGITNGKQLLTELTRIEQSPEAKDLELLTVALSEIPKRLSGLDTIGARLIKIEPEFIQAVEIYDRLHSQVELAMRDGRLDCDEGELPPQDILRPFFQKLYCNPL